MQWRPDAGRWDFELLKHGRHFRFDQQTKIVVGRSADDNATLRRMAAREDASDMVLLVPEGFRGPDALLVGPVTEPALEFAGTLMLRYAPAENRPNPAVCVKRSGGRRVIAVRASRAAQEATPL